ncbi:hypothetical protein KPH14_002476 [Odynerus spinipes]|uniref:C2H2-type domain-containing protein n=1 Tax=Odynerus spinipes TaxID=1348599 RepID=A0AAD9RS47_9HYME|nr:hypothetical protein KPH14_002476 [Odynerus spinipes]
MNEKESRNHVCPRCSQGYKNKRTLDTHLRTACGREPKFQCPYCGLKSKHPPNIYTHIRQISETQQPEETVTSEKLDWSLEGEKTTDATPSTSLEQAIGAGQDITCTQVYARELLRENQSSPNSQDASRCYSCQSCGKSFTRASILQAHAYYRCHLNPVSQLYKSGKNSRFSCYACGSSYSRQNSLMWHVRHECGNPQKCKDCGKTFLYRSSLYRHRSRGCSFHHIKDLAKPESNDLAQIEIDASIAGELVLDPVSV